MAGHQRTAARGAFTGLLGLMLCVTGCRGKPLADKVDDLLKAGRAVEARQEISRRLPALVRNGKLDEVDNVAQVLARRSSQLAPIDAQTVKRSSVSAYLDGIGEHAGELPVDDLCQSALTSEVSPSMAASATFSAYLAKLDRWMEQQKQRRSLAQYCQLLGLDF